MKGLALREPTREELDESRNIKDQDVVELPKKVKALPRKDTVCKFCGVSYLIFSEVRCLEKQLEQAQIQLAKAIKEKDQAVAGSNQKSEDIVGQNQKEIENESNHTDPDMLPPKTEKMFTKEELAKALAKEHARVVEDEQRRAKEILEKEKNLHREQLKKEIQKLKDIHKEKQRGVERKLEQDIKSYQLSLSEERLKHKSTIAGLKANCDTRIEAISKSNEENKLFFQQKLDEMQREMKEAIGKVNDASQGKLNLVIQEKDSLQEKLAKALEECSGANNKQEEMEVKLRSLQGEAEMNNRKIKAELESTRQKLNERSQHLVRTKEQMDMKATEFCEMLKEKSDLEGKYLQSNQEIEALKEKVNSKENALSEIERKYSELATEYQGEKVKFEIALKEHITKGKELEQNNEKLEEMLASQRKEIKDLEESIESQSNISNVKLDHTKKSLQSEIVQLQLLCKQKQDRLQLVEKQGLDKERDFIERIKQLESQFSQSKNIANQRIKQVEESFQQKTIERLTEIEGLKKSLSRAQSEISNLRQIEEYTDEMIQEIESLKGQLEQEKSKTAEQATMLSKQEQEQILRSKNILQTEIANLTKKLQAAEESYRDLLVQNQGMEAQKEQLETSLVQQDKVIQKLETQISGLKLHSQKLDSKNLHTDSGGSLEGIEVLEKHMIKLSELVRKKDAELRVLEATVHRQCLERTQLLARLGES